MRGNRLLLIHLYIFRNIVSGWIGLNDITNEGVFLWRYPIRNSQYTNWERKGYMEPNGGRQGNCVEMIAGRKHDWDYNGTWNDARCTDKFPFICQNIEETGI